MLYLIKEFLFCIVIAILAVIGLFFFSQIAQAFPQTARLGYASCGACHVSPSGGGALSAYGKSMAGELSTWRIGSEDFEESAFISGGDLRYLWFKTKSPKAEVEDRFLMQADLEMGFKIGGLTLIGQYGIYHSYPQDVEASYKHYIMYQRKAWSIRLGKFQPAFGLMTDDHTLPVRSIPGLKQRDASYNAEVTWTGKQWQSAATWILGCQGGYQDKTRLDYCDNDSQGAAWRLSFAPERLFTLGVSAAYLGKADGSNQKVGALSWVVGTKEVYTLGEYAHESNTDQHGKSIGGDSGWVDVMAEWRGLAAGPTYRQYLLYDEQGVKVRWLPVNGFEITLAYLTSKISDRVLAVGHLYF